MSARQPGRDQFPQRGFDLRLEQPRATDQIRKERRTRLLQMLQHQACLAAEAGQMWRFGRRRPCSHPIRVVADKERDGRHAGRHHAPPGAMFAVSVRADAHERRGMWRQPSPSDDPGQAQLIENRGVVSRDAAREQPRLPGVRWGLEALQLPQHFERAALAVHLRTRCNVLPLAQPSHERRGRDRLNFPA
jgi:hypothetical protein